MKHIKFAARVALVSYEYGHLRYVEGRRSQAHERRGPGPLSVAVNRLLVVDDVGDLGSRRD
jgi:hypothetical protein